jgi:hypothetical protein
MNLVMINLTPNFEQFLASISLGEPQVSRMNSAANTLSDVLRKAYGMVNPNVFLQGSYANHTSVEPVDGGEYDLDLVRVCVGDNVATVRYAATKFRDALETMPCSDLVSLADFPRGACGDTCPLLGQYLADCGLGEWQYMSGERLDSHGDMESHAWIEQDGLIVDITADQFPEIDEPVLVSWDRQWHDTFDDAATLNQARLDVYDLDTVQVLESIYERVLQQLDSDPGEVTQ